MFDGEQILVEYCSSDHLQALQAAKGQGFHHWVSSAHQAIPLLACYISFGPELREGPNYILYPWGDVR